VAREHRTKRPERKKVLLLHDNARPHVAKVVSRKIEQLGWQVLPHPPYSPDLAPTDYHLFRSLSNYLRGKQFDDLTELKSSIFYSKTPEFYASDINQLRDSWVRWDSAIDSEGGLYH
jgi:histone-lysine N-methyltransferase SETMAR